MNAKYPNVLVISHNPFSDSQNNGKTLSAFFQGWPKDNIAQLYLTLDQYDTSVCEKFYRITDLDVLNYFVKHKDNTEIFDKNTKQKDDKVIAHKSKGYRFVRDLFVKRLPIMYCFRNFVWNCVKPWKFEKLNKWINNFKPDVIFFQSSNVYKIFDMVMYLKDKYNIPLIMQTTDDYVTQKISLDLFYIINQQKMIKRYRKAVNASNCVFAIGDMMAEEYKERFGGNYKVAMNSVDIQNDLIKYDNVHNDVIQLTYAGNIGLNRWKVLSAIGKALANIQNEHNIKAKLNIYSINEPSKKVLNQLNIKNVMEFKGAINQKQLIDVRNKSDILIHVESFDKKNKYITRLSVSTKIPEYLLSERCILAIGPEDVASIKYIKNNNIGKVITTNKRKEMEQGINDIIQNRKERERFIINGAIIAKNRHSFVKNKEMVQNEIIKSKEIK